MGISTEFWRGRRVLLTGHTGFKGAWTALWLAHLGANVTGYSLAPPSDPNLYTIARVDAIVGSVNADIRDAERLGRVFRDTRPEIVIHLAAQSLVRESYRSPIETYSTNVLGTAQLLEAVRSCETVRAAVIVTSDKCYENHESLWGYRETDRLGGRDPYSSSKACAELVTSAYRASFLQAPSAPSVATARAGNVIGGGDWANDRLIPDVMRALLSGGPVYIRNPDAVRPWQHVLDPLAGYLLLAQRLANGHRELAEAWNFGPEASGTRPVSWVAERLLRSWESNLCWKHDVKPHTKEASILYLDSSKARQLLGWLPRITISEALDWTSNWFRAYRDGHDMQAFTLGQIRQYEALAGNMVA